MDDKKKKELIEKEKHGEEKVNPGWEVDPMEAMICGSSISMLSSGIAIPVINLPDKADEEKKMRE